MNCKHEWESWIYYPNENISRELWVGFICQKCKIGFSINFEHYQILIENKGMYYEVLKKIIVHNLDDGKGSRDNNL